MHGDRSGTRRGAAKNHAAIQSVRAKWRGSPMAAALTRTDLGRDAGRAGAGGTARARHRGRGPLLCLRSRPLQHRRLDLPDRARGRGDPQDRRRRPGRARHRARGGRIGRGARRRHFPGRPDHRPRTGDRFFEVSERHARARRRCPHGLGRARARARPAEPAAQAARAVLSGRHLDQLARDAGRYGRQQRLRRALDPLRHHGRQPARDRCPDGRRRAGQVRRGPGQP